MTTPVGGPVTATAAEHLVQALIAQGSTHAFCVPGESYLAVLDAFHEARSAIRLVTCRHEAAAANMAEAHGKLTGRPGLCFVTRGPGATHAAIGVHTAFQDSTPMILFVGQVARGDLDREGFQELNYAQVFGGIAKWAAQIDQPERIGEYVARAFATAMNGRPGPVVLALPEDMLVETVTAPIPPRVERVRAAPAPEALGQLAALLAQAQRPLAIVGGSSWDRAGIAALAAFLARANIPAGTSFRSKDILDNASAVYAGDIGLGINPALERRIAEADLILAIGTRLGENTTGGYRRLSVPLPGQRLVHVHSGAEELGRVYQPTLAIQANLSLFAQALAGVAVDGSRWAAWTQAAQADYRGWTGPLPDGAGVNLSAVFGHLDATLPADTIVANGAGNYAAWLHRFYQHRHSAGAWKTQLGPASGAMGYGVPAAIGAAIVHPERRVVAVSGDGCFLMSSNELATAVHERVALLFLVINNSQYGTIRMHQERDYPGRVSATGLTNPDFVAYANSFGVAAWRVRETQAFPAALADALAHIDATRTPALIEIVTAPEDIAPGKTLSPKP